jgi:hypothetical protein
LQILNDNPRKYKYNPYPIYSEGVLFLDHKGNRTSLSYMFFLNSCVNTKIHALVKYL